MPASLARRFGLLCLIGFISASSFAFGSGNESVNRDEDLVVTIDSRWPGNAYGGYFPLRIKLSNLGPPRDLVFIYEGLDEHAGSRIPTVRRAVRIEQQATVNFSLSVPVVSSGTSGTVRVYEAGGREIKGLSRNHSLPDYGGHQARTTLLVISSDQLGTEALQPFEDAAATEYAYLAGIGTTGGVTSYSGRYYSSRLADRDHEVVHPSSGLPVNWIDYSGLDLVAVAWNDWSTRLGTAEREAILKWAASGGVLMIYQTGKPAAQMAELNRSLKLEGRAATAWIGCQPDIHRPTNITTAEVLRSGGGHPTAAGSTPTAPANPPVEKLVSWNISPETFSYQDWMLGRVYVFPDKPFPGTPSDWAWWLASVPKDLSRWPNKLGMSSRTANNEFLNFLIPGVGTVPVFAFLTLITLFTVVIGPLNYYWLLKRRRLAAMVFTVPVIALITCMLLFGYSLISDGFSVRSRVNSFTWLDQDRKSAVVMSRICLYAPFAPSSGLTFSPECAVFPVWQTATSFEGGTLDWSGNNQRFASGWLRSQTWTQFQTVEHRDERGRLDFTPPSDPNAESITVSNGLSWELDYLAVKGAGDAWYAGEKIPAGATAQLKRLQPDEITRKFRSTIDDAAWKYPEGVNDSSARTGIHGLPYARYSYEPPLETTFTQGLLKRNVPGAPTDIDKLPKVEIYDWRDARNSLRQDPHPAVSRPHYWALCRTNPGIQTGVKSNIDRLGLHLLFGTF